MRFAASILAVLMLLAVGATVLPSAASAASPRLDRTERNIVRAINHRRARAGLAAVRAGAALNRAADYHSREMAYGNFFAHTSRNGGSMASRVRHFDNARAVGETLAMLGGGCRRHMAARVVNMWMHSGPHRAVLLSGSFRRIGVARRGGRLAGQKACMVTADVASRR